VLIFAGPAACGIVWAMREETYRIGNREHMQQTLARLIPPGTDAAEARRRLHVRGFECDPVVRAEDARWAGPQSVAHYEPLPSGSDVTVCTRGNDVLIGQAFWRVGLVLAQGKVSRVIVLANFRAPL
jgi:hypothetical protein